LRQIQRAKITSMMLSGMANQRRVRGRTPRFPTVSHMAAKARSQVTRRVSKRLRRWERKRITPASRKLQRAQRRLLVISEGNLRPRTAVVIQPESFKEELVADELRGSYPGSGEENG
jgi:hypothetical protein